MASYELQALRAKGGGYPTLCRATQGVLGNKGSQQGLWKTGVGQESGESPVPMGGQNGLAGTTPLAGREVTPGGEGGWGTAV